MIRLENVTKTYNKGKAGEFEALHNISLDIEKGELIAVVGKSGSGKSTLLHILGCVDRFEKGKYYLDDVDVSNISEKKAAIIRCNKVGIVLQDFILVDDNTVLQNVMLPFYFDSSVSLSKAKEKSLKALKQVGMSNYSNKVVGKLSGGQKQRVAIARAIVNSPSIILADEPTGSLDSQTASEILQLFLMLNSQGHTIIMVTHDIEIANQCKRIIEITDGRIC